MQYNLPLCVLYVFSFHFLKSKYYDRVDVLVYILSRIVFCVPKQFVHFHTFGYFSKSSSFVYLP